MYIDLCFLTISAFFQFLALLINLILIKSKIIHFVCVLIYILLFAYFINIKSNYTNFKLSHVCYCLKFIYICRLQVNDKRVKYTICMKFKTFIVRYYSKLIIKLTSTHNAMKSKIIELIMHAITRIEKSK